MRDSRAASLRFILVVSAVLLALLAQMFIRDGGLQWAVAPLVIAVACLALESVRERRKRFGSTTDEDSATAPSQLSFDLQPQPLGWRFRLWNIEFVRSDLGWMAIIAACLLMSVSLRNFGHERPESLTLAWYCFGAAVTLALLGIGALDGRLLDIASRVKTRGGLRIGLRSLTPWLILGVILIIAMAVRLYNLEDVPPGLWYDEADNLSHARQYAQNPGQIPVYERSTNLPTLFLLPIATLVKLTGVAVTTPRLVAAVFGVLGVVFTFLFVRHMLGALAGLIAAFLVAFMRWDIIWSRIGMHGITGVLFAALIGWLTLRALRSGRYSDYAFAGASLGLGMWFYAPIRMFPLALGFILIHHLAVRRPPFPRFALSVFIMIVTALFVAAPVVQVAVDNSEDFFSRSEMTSVFTITPRDKWVEQISESLEEHLLMFNRRGDPNPRHNLPDAPMLDFFIGALFVLGFFFALTQWRNTALFSLPFWVLFMVIPGVLTVPWESPQSLRSILVIPAVAALAAYPLERLWSAGRAASWPQARRYTPPIVLAVLAVIAYVNVDFYFDDQANDPRVYAEFSTEETLMAQSQIEQQRRGYSIWASRQFLFGLIGSLLGSSPKVETIKPPETLPLNSTQVWHGAAVYFEPRERGFWELTRSYYPDGEFNVVTAPNGGEPMYYTAFVSREKLAKRQGLDVAYTRWNEPLIENPPPISESVWHTGDGPAEYPYELSITGALNISVEGEHEFVLDGPLDVAVELDERRILDPEKPRSKVALAAGLHTMSIRGSVTEPEGFIRILWNSPAGGDLEPIPFSNLYRGSVRPVGAVGRFFGSGDASGLPDAVQVAPSLDVFHYFPVIEEPHMAIWEGMLSVERIGTHKFSVEKVSGPVKFYIEDDLIAQDPPSEEVEREGEILIGAGIYPVRVEYMAETRGRSTMFKILWQPPGGDMAPIPIESLTPTREHMLRVIE